MVKFKKLWKGAKNGISACGDWFMSKELVKSFVLGFMMASYAIAANAQKGVGGFTDATTEIESYADPVQKLLYALAAVISLVGAFNIYFKMQNGDQDVKKTIMMTIGGCVAFIAAATALPKFFK